MYLVGNTNNYCKQTKSIQDIKNANTGATDGKDTN